jgi:N-acetylglucosaminyldiphosphoundecaprenol N-acetyl-beta-D-mannosaminyltransferase
MKNTNTEKKFLNISLQTYSQKTILEKMREFILNPGKMKHIVSINPENMVVAQENEDFRLSLESADLHLIDGIGIIWACWFLGQLSGERFAGVDFMQKSIDELSNRSSRVLFLGGKPGIAERLAVCFQKKYPRLTCMGIEGGQNIKNDSTGSKTASILQKIHAFKPHVIFISFGSPTQELWVWHNREALCGTVCVGVGGAFDFIAGTVSRAPVFIRQVGLEWLYRLVVQPWRWKRQLRLFTFIVLVLQQKIRSL